MLYQATRLGQHWQNEEDHWVSSSEMMNRDIRDRYQGYLMVGEVWHLEDEGSTGISETQDEKTTQWEGADKWLDDTVDLISTRHYFFALRFFVPPLEPAADPDAAGPPPSTITASSSLLSAPGVVGLVLGVVGASSSSFMNFDWILARSWSHHARSALPCACSSSIFLCVISAWIISFALWNMVCPQLGDSAFAWVECQYYSLGES